MMALESVKSPQSLIVGERIREHDDFFCSVLELIPSQFYFPPTDEEKASSSKYFKVCLRSVPLFTLSCVRM